MELEKDGEDHLEHSWEKLSTRIN